MLSNGRLREGEVISWLQARDACPPREQAMIHSQRKFVRLALATLLLFAQHVALAHQAHHVFDHPPSASLHAGGNGNFHSELCAFHADFESLLSAVDATPPELHLSSIAFEQFSTAFPRHFPTAPVIPASRGPPYPSSPQS